MRSSSESSAVLGPAWMSWLGVAAILAGVLFTAHEGNEWMRQYVVDSATPANRELPAAVCPADELEEEGISVDECEQLVANVKSYVVSRPDWFSAAQQTLAALGTLLALASVVCGAVLANYRLGAAGIGAALYAALVVIDLGHFWVAQQAGPILRGIHLPDALLWFFVHLGFASAFFVARQAERPATKAAADPAAYGRFEVASHWFFVVSIFFLFVSSWWMLALPLPSADFRYREFPFQLHKNLGLTILLLLIAMAVTRLVRRQALAAVAGESPSMRQVRLVGHAALYLLVFAVCMTGFMSSTYSGWSTTVWWLFDLPYWGREDEELNQLFSDWHLVTCWGLLLAMAAHIGAALLHAVRNDGLVRRILRW
jgi:cytochrome b561